MYLNRIRQPKFVEEVEIKAEFEPADPVVKAEPERGDLSELTYRELLALAKEAEVEVPRGTKKAELLEMLEARK